MVTSYVQLLQQRYRDKLDDKANQFIEFAVGGAKRMQTLIKTLLDYSRVDTRGKALEPTDAERILGQVLDNLNLVIQETHAQITHDPLPMVAGDAPQLARVFQNLIDNAIKFRGPQPPQIHVAATRQGEEWVFSVRDNGIGVEPEHLGRLFVIFQRLHPREKYPGTGIGLALVKRIVERHGGRVWAESKPPEGSTFYFALPVNVPNSTE